MMRVRFESADGQTISEAEGQEGASLLEVGQGIGQPLEGTCEGQMACCLLYTSDAADE